MTERPKTVFWEVDVQADFMLPGGRLYVRGAERLIPQVKRLVDVARERQILLVASCDAHAPNDPEFERFLPHCVRGTPGAEILPQGLLEKSVRIPNAPAASLPKLLSQFQQIILEKQTLDVFDNPRTGELIARLAEAPGADNRFFVFGVVTEYCVRCAAQGLLERGQKVSVITDAIETLNPVEGSHTTDELKSLGARLVTTEEVLAEVG